MTAAKVMDIISRLPGCAGQAADAVSAFTPVKMEVAPTLLEIPKSGCPDIWIRLPKHKWPKIMVQYGRSSRSSWAKSVRSSFGRTVMGTAISESCIRTRLGKSSESRMFIRIQGKKDDSCLCMWPSVGNSHEIVDLGEPTSFLDNVFFFGLHSKRMSDKQGYCGWLQKYVRINDFCRGYGKIDSHKSHGET